MLVDGIMLWRVKLNLITRYFVAHGLIQSEDYMFMALGLEDGDDGSLSMENAL